MHYFQAHSIIVFIEFSLKNILSKVNLSGQLSKWIVEIGQFDMKFLFRTTIKEQVLANFVAELSPRTMSLWLNFFTSTHEEEGSSVGTSARITLSPKGPEGHKEPPQIDDSSE